MNREDLLPIRLEEMLNEKRRIRVDFPKRISDILVENQYLIKCKLEPILEKIKYVNMDIYVQEIFQSQVETGGNINIISHNNIDVREFSMGLQASKFRYEWKDSIEQINYQKKKKNGFGEIKRYTNLTSDHAISHYIRDMFPTYWDGSRLKLKVLYELRKKLRLFLIFLILKWNLEYEKLKNEMFNEYEEKCERYLKNASFIMVYLVPWLRSKRLRIKSDHFIQNKNNIQLQLSLQLLNKHRKNNQLMKKNMNNGIQFHRMYRLNKVMIMWYDYFLYKKRNKTSLDKAKMFFVSKNQRFVFHKLLSNVTKRDNKRKNIKNKLLFSILKNKNDKISYNNYLNQNKLDETYGSDMRINIYDQDYFVHKNIRKTNDPIKYFWLLKIGKKFINNLIKIKNQNELYRKSEFFYKEKLKRKRLMFLNYWKRFVVSKQISKQGFYFNRIRLSRKVIKVMEYWRHYSLNRKNVRRAGEFLRRKQLMKSLNKFELNTRLRLYLRARLCFRGWKRILINKKKRILYEKFFLFWKKKVRNRVLLKKVFSQCLDFYVIKDKCEMKWEFQLLYKIITRWRKWSVNRIEKRRGLQMWNWAHRFDKRRLLGKVWKSWWENIFTARRIRLAKHYYKFKLQIKAWVSLRKWCNVRKLFKQKLYNYDRRVKYIFLKKMIRKYLYLWRKNILVYRHEGRVQYLLKKKTKLKSFLIWRRRYLLSKSFLRPMVKVLEKKVKFLYFNDLKNKTEIVLRRGFFGIQWLNQRKVFQNWRRIYLYRREVTRRLHTRCFKIWIKYTEKKRRKRALNYSLRATFLENRLLMKRKIKYFNIWRIQYSIQVMRFNIKNQVFKIWKNHLTINKRNRFLLLIEEDKKQQEVELQKKNVDLLKENEKKIIKKKVKEYKMYMDESNEDIGYEYSETLPVRDVNTGIHMKDFMLSKLITDREELEIKLIQEEQRKRGIEEKREEEEQKKEEEGEEKGQFEQGKEEDVKKLIETSHRMSRQEIMEEKMIKFEEKMEEIKRTIKSKLDNNKAIDEEKRIKKHGHKHKRKHKHKHKHKLKRKQKHKHKRRSNDRDHSHKHTVKERMKKRYSSNEKLLLRNAGKLKRYFDYIEKKNLNQNMSSWFMRVLGPEDVVKLKITFSIWKHYWKRNRITPDKRLRAKLFYQINLKKRFFRNWVKFILLKPFLKLPSSSYIRKVIREYEIEEIKKNRIKK